MNRKKHFGKHLLTLANIVFWVAMYVAWFDIFWEEPSINQQENTENQMGISQSYMLRSLFLTFTAVTSFLIVIYSNWFWLVRKYLANQKYWAYAWRLIILLVIVSSLMSFHPSFAKSWAHIGSGGKVFFQIPVIVTIIYLYFMIVLFTSPLYLSYNWFLQNAQLAALKNEKLETELSFLKSQINPHFFFNTLNNLYALTLENSAAAPQVILKLSDLMRYTIYDGRANRVALTQEVAFIENYLELQRIRLYKKSNITFQQNISNLDLKVPPLLFVVFLENAFKHGVETLRNNAIVDLQLSEKEGIVKFYAMNNYDHEERPMAKGLGLDNIKRRLKLLFEEHYKLEIVDQENSFRVYLTININT